MYKSAKGSSSLHAIGVGLGVTLGRALAASVSTSMAWMGSDDLCSSTPVVGKSSFLVDFWKDRPCCSAAAVADIEPDGGAVGVVLVLAGDGRGSFSFSALYRAASMGGMGRNTSNPSTVIHSTMFRYRQSWKTDGLMTWSLTGPLSVTTHSKALQNQCMIGIASSTFKA